MYVCVSYTYVYIHATRGNSGSYMLVHTCIIHIRWYLKAQQTQKKIKKYWCMQNKMIHTPETNSLPSIFLHVSNICELNQMCTHTHTHTHTHAHTITHGLKHVRCTAWLMHSRMNCGQISAGSTAVLRPHQLQLGEEKTILNQMHSLGHIHVGLGWEDA